MTCSIDQPISGRAWKFGESINTDVMAPSNRGGTLEELKRNTMAAIRPEFPLQVQPGDIIVAGRNFGCGSHREAANDTLRRVGISAVVAESVARLFLRTSVAIGFPTFVAPGVSDMVEDGQRVAIDYGEGVVRNLSTGAAVKLTRYPPSVERIFRAGGIIPLLVQRYSREGRPG